MVYEIDLINRTVKICKLDLYGIGNLKIVSLSNGAIFECHLKTSQNSKVFRGSFLIYLAAIRIPVHSPVDFC